MRKILLFLFAICISNILYAQDIIVKKDGSTIIAKVLEISQAEVKYKKQSNLEGPTYTISTSELLSINYPNGEKETFASTSQTAPSTSSNPSSPKYIEKQADSRNAEIIAMYNKEYKTTKKLSTSKSPAKEYFLIFGVKSSSIMSNEDVEIKFIRKKCDEGYYVHYINITNKSNKTIYIDKVNCFRIGHDGSSYCYFDASKQLTVNQGGGSGGSLNLGSVAGALGVGGAIGQIAGGVNVGGASTRSVSKSFSQQRIIAIPPHANKNLSEEKWVKIKSHEYESVEKAENFYYNCKSSEIGLRRGMVNKGGSLIFYENDSPIKREYIITYSADETFQNYSSLKTELFLHQLIGTDYDYSSSYYKLEKYIEGINEYVIFGSHHTTKD